MRLLGLKTLESSVLDCWVQYADTLLKFAPELKAANSNMKIGANGRNNMTEVGEFDKGLGHKNSW